MAQVNQVVAPVVGGQPVYGQVNNQAVIEPFVGGAFAPLVKKDDMFDYQGLLLAPSSDGGLRSGLHLVLVTALIVGQVIPILANVGAGWEYTTIVAFVQVLSVGECPVLRVAHVSDVNAVEVQGVPETFTVSSQKSLFVMNPYSLTQLSAALLATFSLAPVPALSTALSADTGTTTNGINIITSSGTTSAARLYNIVPWQILMSSPGLLMQHFGAVPDIRSEGIVLRLQDLFDEGYRHLPILNNENFNLLLTLCFSSTFPSFSKSKASSLHLCLFIEPPLLTTFHPLHTNESLYAAVKNVRDVLVTITQTTALRNTFQPLLDFLESTSPFGPRNVMANRGFVTGYVTKLLAKISHHVRDPSMAGLPQATFLSHLTAMWTVDLPIFTQLMLVNQHTTHSGAPPLPVPTVLPLVPAPARVTPAHQKRPFNGPPPAYPNHHQRGRGGGANGGGRGYYGRHGGGGAHYPVVTAAPGAKNKSICLNFLAHHLSMPNSPPCPNYCTRIHPPTPLGPAVKTDLSALVANPPPNLQRSTLDKIAAIIPLLP